LRSIIVVAAFAALLSGCGTPSNVTNARNEMGYACAADVQDEPFVSVGHGLITGHITAEMNREIAERNTARRQAARAYQPAYCPPDAPRHDQAASQPIRQSVDQQRQAETVGEMQQNLWLQNQQLQWQLQAQQLQDFSMRSQPRLIIPAGGGGFMMLP
jgi:hypothetical protein